MRRLPFIVAVALGAIVGRSIALAEAPPSALQPYAFLIGDWQASRSAGRYAVSSPAAGEAVFVSDAIGGEPRYRLTYTLDPTGVLKGEFSIAPPGQPDGFKLYLAWESRKR